MKILGIDPGFGRIGFGCVERTGSSLTVLTFGLIETPKIPLPQRLLMIDEKITALIAEQAPDALVTERLLFAANRTTALDVSKALGVILVAGERHRLPWFEYSPPEIKLSVTGNGAATKDQVKFMAARLLNLTTIPGADDVADALAIALTHALRTNAIGHKPPSAVFS